MPTPLRTVSQMTGRRWAQLVHVETAAVAHSNIHGPLTTAIRPVKTDLTDNNAISGVWVRPIEPTRGRSAAVISGYAFSWHSDPGFACKSVPGLGEVVVALLYVG